MYDLGELESDQHATAKWADPDYIAKTYRYEPGKIWLGRNPHNHNQAIGYYDDRHVLVCAGSGGGKGRSIIIPNLTKWPGSIVSVDPKGENATICAERRAKGRPGVCDGMGQETFVLDPFRCAKVPDELRAFYNPLDALDPNNGNLLIKAQNMGRALTVFPESADGEDWAEEGAEFLALVIALVVTSRFLEDEERHLGTVREFAMQGNQRAVEYDNELRRLSDEELKQQFGVTNPAEFRSKRKKSPWDHFFDELAESNACGGELAQTANGWRHLYENGTRHWASATRSAKRQLLFLTSPEICSVVLPSSKGKRFDPHLLKDSETPVSVFLSLPEEDYETCKRWQRLMIETILMTMQKNQELPACGHKVLFSIDEFLSLGKMDTIGKGMNSIRGAGAKLFLSVTNIGDLKEFYKDGYDKFFGMCGLRIFFDADGPITGKFISDQLGEKEVRKIVRSANFSRNEQHSTARAEGHTRSRGTAYTEALGDSWSENKTRSRSSQWNRQRGRATGDNWSNSRTNSAGRHWGDGTGYTASDNYSPDWFFADWLGKSKSRQRNRNRSRNLGHAITSGQGGSVQENEGFSRGVNKGVSTTTGRGGSKTVSNTLNENEAWTNSLTETDATGETAGIGIAEQFFKKPLLSINEVDRYLATVKMRDHQAYPGLALIKIPGELPFFLRKCYYDEDQEFIGCFTPNPDFTFVPIHQQKLLGCQYTEDHIFPLKLPALLVEEGYEANALVEESDWFNPGQPLFALKRPDGMVLRLKSPLEGKVIELPDDEEKESLGAVCIFRAEKEMDDQAALEFKKYLFTHEIELVKKRRRLALEEKAAAEREAARQEQIKKEQEAAAKRARERQAEPWKDLDDAFRSLSNNLGFFDDIGDFMILWGWASFIMAGVIAGLVNLLWKFSLGPEQLTYSDLFFASIIWGSIVMGVLFAWRQSRLTELGNEYRRLLLKHGKPPENYFSYLREPNP